MVQKVRASVRCELECGGYGFHHQNSYGHPAHAICNRRQLVHDEIFAKAAERAAARDAPARHDGASRI